MSRGPGGRALSDYDLVRCIGLAVKSGKVVHVAVNTIPDYIDYNMFAEKCRHYESLGVDGLILNDFGLIQKLLSDGVKAPVFTSVGCGVHNIEDIGFFASEGVAGVVLQPGITPKIIEDIKSKYDIKIEIFCEVLIEPFLFGRCWLGSYIMMNKKHINGKVCFLGSAKRGGCSKACRAKWEVFREKSLLAGGSEFPFIPYSLSGKLKDYIGAGVDYIKIQGRDLPPEVVSSIVKNYAEEINTLYEG